MNLRGLEPGVDVGLKLPLLVPFFQEDFLGDENNKNHEQKSGDGAQAHEGVVPVIHLFT